MNVEEEVRTNSRDIQTLTNTVTRVVTIVENAEKRHESDMVTIKDAVKSIQDLNQKMTATIGMQKDIEGMSEKVTECREDIRVLRHDMRGFESVAELVTLLNKEVAELRTHNQSFERITSENSRKIERHGEQLSDVTSDIASLKAEMKSFTAIKDKAEGATGAARWLAGIFWTVFGTGILAIGGFVIQKYFTIEAIHERPRLEAPAP